MSSTINSDLRSISMWGTRNLVKFNTSNYPVIIDDSEIPHLNSINIIGLQISSSLFWRDHIVQIAKPVSKKLGFFFGVNNILILLNYSNCILLLFVPAWNIALISGVLLLILLFSVGLNQRLSAWLVIPPWPRLLTLCLFAARWLLCLFYRYYFGHCCEELATSIPPPMAQPRSTQQALFAHNFCVELSNARINRFCDGFFPSTSRLWNSLLSSVFPASFNHPSFLQKAGLSPP